jgi:hypothetical protein
MYYPHAALRVVRTLLLVDPRIAVVFVGSLLDWEIAIMDCLNRQQSAKW